MAHSRLHIICGNCGSNADFKYEIAPEGHDYGDHVEPAVWIWCNNCGTLHDLSDFIEEKGKTMSASCTVKCPIGYTCKWEYPDEDYFTSKCYVDTGVICAAGIVCTNCPDYQEEENDE